MTSKEEMLEELRAEVAADKAATEASMAARKAYRKMQYARDRALMTEEAKLKQRKDTLDWQSKNRERITNKIGAQRRANKLRAVLLFGGACHHCGGKFHPAVFDFHHVSDDKELGLGTLMNYAWEKIEKELGKCVMLCANCHRVEHYDEDKWQETET